MAQEAVNYRYAGWRPGIVASEPAQTGIALWKHRRGWRELMDSSVRRQPGLVARELDREKNYDGEVTLKAKGGRP